MVSLSKLAGENDSTIERLSSQHAKKVQNLLPSVVDFIRENRLSTGQLGATNVSLGFVRSLLISSGINDWLDFGPELEEAAQEFQKQIIGTEAEGLLSISGTALFDVEGADLGQLGQGARQALASVAEDMNLSLGRVVDDLVLAVKSELELMQIAPVSVKDASARISSRLSLAESRVRTIVNTGLSAVQRKVNAELGKRLTDAGFEVLYSYEGPSQNARPFCRSIVGKTFTVEQIGKMNNGQGLSVQNYGGGYNCRHSWFVVSKELADQEGFEKGTQSDINKANPG